jgi:two-component system, LytTR family, sensor kinase
VSEGAGGVAGGVARALDRPAARWALLFAVWTGLALISATQSALYRAHRGRPIDWPVLLADRLADWYTCAAFTPAYFWLVRRFPIDRQHWATSVPVHLITTSVFVVIKYAAYGAIGARLSPDPEAWRLGELLAGSFVYESMAFWAVLAVVHAVEFHRRFREREVQAARLQAELAEARLDALSAQLNPHFLFNALHGVSTLMHRDVEAADSVLARLADLLRRTLRGGGHEVPLAEEMELLRDYLAIMATRYGDRLAVGEVVSPEAECALVPRFVLQPLVENALQHGVARRVGAGRVEVRAERAGESLQLSVSDDGPGLRGGGAFPREGIGLSNTRRRLRALYGDRQRLAIEEVPGGGLRVALTLPFRPAPTGAASALRPERPRTGLAG